MALAEELAEIAEAARAYAAPGEELAAVIPAEPAGGVRVYLCAYGAAGRDKSWLAIDADAQPLIDRPRLREAVSIAALCELAEEVAGGGNLEELRSQLLTLRITENPPGIEEAEEAALELERVVARTPRVATPTHLDLVGAAARRLEQALGESAASPFTTAMKAALDAVEALKRDVEASYKLPLDG